MVDPNKLIKKFPLKYWYGKENDTKVNIELTAEEMCYLFAQLCVASHIEKLNSGEVKE